DPAVLLDVPDGRQVPRVGQGVVDGDLVIGGGEDVADVVRPDEPGPAGDELLHPISFDDSAGAQRRVRPAARGQVGPPGVGHVTGGQHGVVDAPVGADVGVVPRDAQLVGRVVVAVDQVGDGHVGERREAVGDARRDVDTPVVVLDAR